MPCVCRGRGLQRNQGSTTPSIADRTRNTLSSGPSISQSAMSNLQAVVLLLQAADWAAVVSAAATVVIALFTIVLAFVGRRQIADTRILQRAYVTVVPKGIEWHSSGVLVGQVAFKNVGKLPATAFVSIVNKIVVRNAEWVTPTLTDAAL